MAARRLQQNKAHKNRQGHARQPHKEECRPPIEKFDRPAASQQAGHAANGNAKRKNGYRRGPLLGREIIRYQRMRRRAAASLANADANSGQQQMPEILRQPAHGGHQAPDRKRGGNDIDPRGTIRQPRNRDAESREKDREGDAGKKAQLRIGKLQILFYRL